MTRGPKSSGKDGGPETDAGRTRTGKTHIGKTQAGKPPVAKASVTKSPPTKIPVTESSAAKPPANATPVTETAVAKKASSPRKTARPPRAGAGAKTDAPHNGDPKSAGPNGAVPRKANRRGAARLAAVQALYQMDMTGAGLNEILAQFESHWLGREVEGEQYLPAEAAFFRDIVSGVVDVQRDLDPRIDAALEATWPLKRIEAILRSVLRAGAYELQKRTDIPARVVVSEYVDVANAFVDGTETGMVNAVLDRLARNVRSAEFG